MHLLPSAFLRELAKPAEVLCNVTHLFTRLEIEDLGVDVIFEQVSME